MINDDQNLNVTPVQLTDELKLKLEQKHKRLRIYSIEFPVLEQDYDIERFNIGIDKDNIIKDMWFG